MALRRISSTGKIRLRGSGKFALTAAAVISGGSAATAVTVTDYLDQRVFQRVGTTKSVPVTVNFTGSPSVIQARAVDATTLAAVTAWTTIATNPSGTSCTGNLPTPQGGWYLLEARDGVNTALTHRGSNKFGVGVVVGLIGQSNMVNFPATPDKYPLGSPRAIEFKSNVFRRVGNINDSLAAGTIINGTGGYAGNYTNGPGSKGDGYVFLANLLSAGLGVPVCLVERAVGGQAIDTWTNGTSNNWTAFAAMLTAAGGDMEAALWMQGESDADTMSTATMVTKLGIVQSQCHSATGRNSSNFHFGVISLGQGFYNGSSEGEFGNMRAAHVQFANNTAGAFLATAAHDTKCGSTDFVHIEGSSFARMGPREARSLLSRFGVGVSGSGPRITGATRSGTTVTVSITHSGGTALTDGLGGTGSALTGFQFFDAGAAGAEIAQASSTISGNTLVLTLASAPVGALTMAYAMMNNPHGADSKSFVPASVVYDNVAIYNSTVGCPLQPLAAITVT